MFTGLVEEIGIVTELRAEGPTARLTVKAPRVSCDAAIGASIAVNGCCLTVVNEERGDLTFDVGQETLDRTNLGRLKKGSGVNLERALKLGDRLGGHYVSGHIDGVGTVQSRQDSDSWSTVWFNAPGDLTRQMVSKGSIAVDGVSLTLIAVMANGFSVMLVPHTMGATTLGKLGAGSEVNLETDLLAKYVQRQLECRGLPEYLSGPLSTPFSDRSTCSDSPQPPGLTT